MSKTARIEYLTHQREVCVSTLAGYRDLAEGYTGPRRAALVHKAECLVKRANGLTKELHRLGA